MFGIGKQKAPAAAAEASDLQARLEELERQNAELAAMLEKVAESRVRTDEQRAADLVDGLIEASKIVPAQAAEIRDIYLGLLDRDQSEGTEHAEAYARQLREAPGHGWTTELVAPGQRHQNAALGIEGLAPSAGSGAGPGRAKVNLSGGRRVLDPAEGTQTVGGKAGVSAERFAELLASTDDGRAALASIRAGKMDVADIKRKVGLA